MCNNIIELVFAHAHTPLLFAFPPKSHQMSKKRCPQLKVLLLGDHDAGKTRYLITLMKNRLSPQDTYTPGIAYSFTLTLTIPGASPLEDPIAWQGWRDSGERKTSEVREPEGQQSLSTKKEAIIAPWDVITGLAPDDRLHRLAYPHTSAIALCFSVVDRVSFHNIRDKVISHYISIFSLVLADLCPSGILKPLTFSPTSQYYSWG